MRLRVSGDQTEKTYDLAAVIGEGDASATLPQGDLLNAFVEAVCAREPADTAAARQAVCDRMGEAAMVDAAAVIAAFNAYPRVADATGIPLEDAKEEATVGLRAELQLDQIMS